MKYAVGSIVIVLLLAILGPQALFTVDETQLVVVTRFGEIQEIHTTPGLKVKAPFLESVNRFDRRVLRIDTPPRILNDVEKQNLVIDAYSRYRITEVRKFFEKLRTLNGAGDRIGSIVTNKLKEEIALRTRAEIIGGQTQAGTNTVIPTNSRQEILDKVVVEANAEVGPEGEDFGIEIIDVRIKRAEFPEDALPNIFARMRAERDRISRETRALGAEEDARIRAKAERDRTIILADAQRQANITRGEGEARAIEIFAQALEQDPEFFAFQRSLEAYREFLSTDSTVLLSSDAELFQYLEEPSFVFIPSSIALVGAVQGMVGNSWTVGDRGVMLTGNTLVTLPSAPMVGDVVFVEGSPQDDGTILASHVMAGLSGQVESISLSQVSVDGVTVLVPDSAELLVDPASVGTIYVEGSVSDGTLVAERISEGVRGTLESISGTTWTVGTTEVEVPPDATVEEGADVLGTDVLLAVTRINDGTRIATNVALLPGAAVATDDTETSPDEGQLEGGIGSPLVGSATFIVSSWSISGAQAVVLVDSDTNLQLGANQVGLVVLVGFEQASDGSLVAREIRTP